MAIREARAPDLATRRAALLAGLGVGAVVAYVLYRFFDPVNLFALRLQEAAVSAPPTSPRCRWGWPSPSPRG